MSEDIGLRFALVAKLDKMSYGDAVLLSRREVEKAWPPTGDHDRSPEGMFHALALMAGGHRPETSMTTIERIHHDFGEIEFAPVDQQFDVSQDYMTGDYIIKRKLDKCPRCFGRGYREDYEPFDGKLIFTDEMLEQDTEVLIKTVPCDHAPETTDS